MYRQACVQHFSCMRSHVLCSCKTVYMKHVRAVAQRKRMTGAGALHIPVGNKNSRRQGAAKNERATEVTKNKVLSLVKPLIDTQKICETEMGMQNHHGHDFR